MAQRFRGESVHKVDGKGRVSIPAQFRRVIEAGDPEWKDGLSPFVTIVYGGKQRDFLEAYTEEAIADVDARIERLPRGSKQRRAMEHFFNGQSVRMQIDDTGRLVLSQKLRDKIGISNEAYFLGSGDTFQIWSPDGFDDKNADIEEFLDSFGDDFDPLTLLEGTDAPAADAGE